MQYYRSGWSVSIEGQRTQACSHLGKAGAPRPSLVSPSTRSASGRAGPEANDELVVRDFRLGTAKGDLLVINRKAVRLYGGLNGLPGWVARVVIDDLHIDPTVDGPLELVKNRRHT